MMLDFVFVWPGIHDPQQNGNGNGHHTNGDEDEEAGDGNLYLSLSVYLQICIHSNHLIR